jgi:hypothetical protein
MHDKEFRILVLVTTYFLFSKSDEVFVVPWTFIDKSLVVAIELGVDDQGMMKNQRDLKNGQLACQFVCVFVCVLYFYTLHVKAPKWWELWRYFSVYEIMKNVIVDL